jgi:hypothetical protein
MNTTAAQAIEAADWKVLGPALLSFTHDVIARFRWRGLKVTTSPEGRLTIGDKSPDDFIFEAAEKLVHGPRTYRKDMTLEVNLRRTIESDIDNFKKKTRRRPPILDRTRAEAIANPEHPLDTLIDGDETEYPMEKDELVRRQREMLEAFRLIITGEKELLLLLDAYEKEKYKPAEIEDATNIDAARVSELKRKLKQRADKFIMNHPQYADLNPLKEAL